MVEKKHGFNFQSREVVNLLVLSKFWGFVNVVELAQSLLGTAMNKKSMEHVLGFLRESGGHLSFSLRLSELNEVTNKLLN